MLIVVSCASTPVISGLKTIDEAILVATSSVVSKVKTGEAVVIANIKSPTDDLSKFITNK